VNPYNYSDLLSAFSDDKDDGNGNENNHHEEKREENFSCTKRFE